MPEEEKKANLRRFLGNLKVHLKTKSAPMVCYLYDDSEVINNVSRQQPFQFVSRWFAIFGLQLDRSDTK